MKREHHITITRDQMNELKRKQQPKKKRQSFIEGSDVLVNVDTSKNGRWIEASVLSYDSDRDIYTVLSHDGLTLKFKSNKVKGWWSK